MIDSLNRIGGQPCALFLIVFGSGFWYLCAHTRLDTNPAAGILGAGLLLFQTEAKTTTTISAPNATTQNVTPPPQPSL
jgi:hypothetical protein